MTLGDGILFSTVLIILTIAAWRLTVNRKWKLIGMITGVVVALLAILVGVWMAYLRYESRPQDVTEVGGIRLGMTPVEVTLAKGEPTSVENQVATEDVEKQVSYLYKTPGEDGYSLVVAFRERASQMRASIICERNGVASILGFGPYSSESAIEAKLGPPGNVSINSAGLAKIISYPKWHAAFELEKGWVREICASSSGTVSFIDQYKEQPKNSTDTSGLPYPAPRCKNGAKLCKPWEREWSPGAVLPAGSVIDSDGMIWPKGKPARTSAPIITPTH